jgi:sugar phosphate isomerase/epimerase
VSKPRFGVSTRLYSTQRLGRDQLIEIGAYGFEVIELFGARTHLDYANPAAVADLQQWLAEAKLELFSVQVPADQDAEQALFIARRIPFDALVVAATTPRETAKAVEKLAPLAEALHVRIAIDSATMTPIGSVVHFVESDRDADVGICLDFASAHKAGDLAETIELVAEHLVAARLPIDSNIDWASAMTTAQKIGYDAGLIFDADPRGSAKETLARARTARGRIERWLTSI